MAPSADGDGMNSRAHADALAIESSSQTISWRGERSFYRNPWSISPDIDIDAADCWELCHYRQQKCFRHHLVDGACSVLALPPFGNAHLIPTTASGCSHRGDKLGADAYGSYGIRVSRRAKV